MKDRVRSVGAGAVCLAVMLSASAPAGAQDLEDWQNAELRTLIAAVDEARREERAPDEGAITWLPSYLKGAADVTYVPFTLLIDPAAVSDEDGDVQDNVVAYVALAEPGSDPSDRAFENGFYAGTGEREGDRVRIPGNLQAEGGEYDIYIAIRYSFDRDAPVERSLDPTSRQVVETAVVPPITLLRERVTIPDFWNDNLQISSVILTQAVRQLTQQPSEDEIARSPYLVGANLVEPKLNGDFTKQDMLGFVFAIYNPGHSGGMPDITADYDFYERTDGGEEFVNRTDPRVYNDQTLPPGFDVRQRQLVEGLEIPLGEFEVGDYRLEIKVTDNEEGAELTQDLFFSVADD